MQELPNASAVIDALGGTVAVATLTDRFKQQVSSWRKSNNFPSKLYPLMRNRLQAIGFTAPAELWSIEEAKEAAE
jgi:hypothetical protein